VNPPDILFPTVCEYIGDSSHGGRSMCFTLPPEITSFSFKNATLDPNVWAADAAYAIDSHNLDPIFPATGYRVEECKGISWYYNGSQWKTYTAAQDQPVCNKGAGVPSSRVS
jgi:hypothetical protein